MRVYPENNNPVTIVKQVGIWAGFDSAGSIQEAIPANTISKPFIIKGIYIADAELIGTYQVRIYIGAEGAETGEGACPFVMTEKTSAELAGNGCDAIPANSRVAISIVGDMEATSNIKIYVRYEYLYG